MGGDIAFFQMIPDGMRWPVVKMLFNAQARQTLYAKIANKLRNNMPMTRILEGMAATASKKSPGGWEEWLYKQFLLRFQKQPRLSYVLADLAPTMEIVLLSSGESNPKIFVNSLDTICNMMQRQKTIRKAFTGALMKPFFYMAALIAMIVMLGTSFFPAIEDMLKREFWPESARFLYGTSEFIVNDWPVVVIVAIGSVIALGWSFKNLTGEVRKVLDKYGPWAIYKIVLGAGWMLGLGSIIASGRTEMDAVTIIMQQTKNNKWLFERTKAVLDKYKSSRNLGTAMDTGYDFPERDLIFDLRDYAELPNFAEILAKEANRWIDDAILMIQRKANFIGMAFMIIFMVVLMMSFVSVFTITDQVVAMAQQSQNM